MSKRIAVLSGKGGSGKTTIATNLARIMGLPYVDLDVEEPNGFIFIKPKVVNERTINAFYPVIDETKCIKCGKCADSCKFNAIANTGKRLLIYEKLCHGCGVCTLVCENKAILEGSRDVGKVEEAKDDMGILAYRGVMNVGEAMAGPVISYIKEELVGDEYIADCAPGCSCNVVKALLDVDFAVLVGEDTQFGLHDLKLAADLCDKMHIPYGVVVNKAMTDEYSLIVDYCIEEGKSLLGIVPFSKDAAKLYSRGKLISENPVYHDVFKSIADKIEGDVL